MVFIQIHLLKYKLFHKHIRQFRIYKEQSIVIKVLCINVFKKQN